MALETVARDWRFESGNACADMFIDKHIPAFVPRLRLNGKMIHLPHGHLSKLRGVTHVSMSCFRCSGHKTRLVIPAWVQCFLQACTLKCHCCHRGSSSASNVTNQLCPLEAHRPCGCSLFPGDRPSFSAQAGPPRIGPQYIRHCTWRTERVALDTSFVCWQWLP